ncbi:MAG TPA: hypothetical protein VFU43_14775 [Streptosporangiaceae bacterium]|nr:hypothetical protein [Streptosporangiaceae bacterium]
MFLVIGVAALAVGVDRLADDDFAALVAESPAAFRVMCGALVLIAVLGMAITPAERALIEPSNAGFARFGAALAYLGHGGTIAFFSWAMFSSPRDANPGAILNTLAPLEWGMMFELVFVGAWVWIMAGVMRGEPTWPTGFVLLSIAKATSFWMAFLAFLTGATWFLLLGAGTVTFVTGPAWHLWIAQIFKRRAGDADAGGARPLRGAAEPPEAGWDGTP